MRITIVQGAFFPVPPLLGGAVEKVWFGLGKEFAKRGHIVEHVSRAYPGLPPRENIAGVEHRRFSGYSSPKSIVVLKALDLVYSLCVLKRLEPADVLITNTFWLPILSRNTNAGKLYVHVARFPRGQMRLYKHAARLQTVSHVIANAIKAEVPKLAPRVVVIPNPVEVPSAPRGLEAKEKVILYVGRVHPEKGIDALLDAFANVHREVPDAREWRLVVVGPHLISQGGGGEAYYSELKRRQIANVDWLGPIFEPTALLNQYSRAAIFVYPTMAEFGEASPVAPLEAMASGCATVVPEFACFDDYMEAEKTGVTFRHHSTGPAALASQVRRLILSSEERENFGKEARIAAGKFSYSAIADQYLMDFSRVNAE